jgi:hypothetical protein
LIDDFDEQCVPVRRDRCSTTSNSSNDDQNGKSSSEIIDKEVFLIQNSDITANLFFLT